MKKEFDFDQVGKKLPYKAPDSYIENLSPHALINRPKKRFKSPKRLLIYAAAFVVILVVSSLMFVNSGNNKAIENFDQELDAIASFNTVQFENFIKNLTDEELATIAVILDSELFDN